MIVETERLLVRRMRESDCRDLHEYLLDPETYVSEPGEPIGLDTARALARKRSEGADFLAVVLRGGEKMIGHLYFKQVEPLIYATWELGYIFNQAFRRRGYASEASRAIVEQALRRVPPAFGAAHRVRACCDPRNVASWRVLEKIGMRREAHHKSNAFHRRGADGSPIWHDSYEYAMLAEDLDAACEK